jgi:lysophospholipase L1-like esterase
VRRALAFLPALLACGQSGPFGEAPKSEPQASLPAISRPAAAQAPAPAAPGEAGPLYYANNLRRFHEALARLDEGRATRDVRVLHFGDSHTAADLETGAVRHVLQARFGDGGRGFVAVGRPWKTYLQEGIKASGQTKDWVTGKASFGKSKNGAPDDGCYGLGGVCMIAQRKARAWAELTAVASRIELSYFEQPQGGSFEVWVDGARAARVGTKAAAPASAYKTIDVVEGPHQLELRTMGDGDVRFFGVSLDRAQVGVIYDALGINGARVTTPLAWSETHLAEQLKHHAPDLVVLAYGTNESFDDTPIASYEKQLVELLGRIARAVPGASCLLLGPPDRGVETKDGWVSSPRLEEVVAAQKRVAAAAGCAFFDQLEAMGGPGTIAKWFEEPEPRAQKDRVHLTRLGYQKLGTTFAGKLLEAYAAWRAEKGLAPVAAPPIPSALPPPLPPPHEEPHAPEPLAHPNRPSPFVAIPM